MLLGSMMSVRMALQWKMISDWRVLVAWVRTASVMFTVTEIEVIIRLIRIWFDVAVRIVNIIDVGEGSGDAHLSNRRKLQIGS